MHVYLITNKVNGKVYVGQTVLSLQSRWKNHLSDVKIGSNLYLHNAIRKYGPDNFLMESLAVVLDRKQLNPLEILWILTLRSYDPSVGYNSTFGGQCGTIIWTPEMRQKARKQKLGTHHSEETKRKISVASKGSNNGFFGKTHTGQKALEGCRKGGKFHRGKKRTEETRDNIKKALIGKPKTEEHRKAMREAQLGKTLSEETKGKISKWASEVPRTDEWRANISKAVKGRKRTPEQIERIRQGALSRWRPVC